MDVVEETYIVKIKKVKGTNQVVSQEIMLDRGPEDEPVRHDCVISDCYGTGSSYVEFDPNTGEVLLASKYDHGEYHSTVSVKPPNLDRQDYELK